jgi:hypothetical protein
MSETASLPMSAGPFPLAHPEKSLTLTQTPDAPLSFESPLLDEAMVPLPLTLEVPLLVAPLDDAPVPVPEPLLVPLLVAPVVLFDPVPLLLLLGLPAGGDVLALHPARASPSQAAPQNARAFFIRVLSSFAS